jgi:hypothetical protein
MAAHKFKLGELVELARTSGIYAGPGPYEIVRLLPEVDGEPQYRVRGRHEDHERMVKQSGLKRYMG